MTCGNSNCNRSCCSSTCSACYQPNEACQYHQSALCGNNFLVCCVLLWPRMPELLPEQGLPQCLACRAGFDLGLMPLLPRTQYCVPAVHACLHTIYVIGIYVAWHVAPIHVRSMAPTYTYHPPSVQNGPAAPNATRHKGADPRLAFLARSG